MAKSVVRTLEVKNSVAAGAATDVADLSSCEVQIFGTFSQTMVIQGSNDKTNWVDLTTVTSSGLTAVSKKWAWLRINTTVHSSGSAVASVAGRVERSKVVALEVKNSVAAGAKYGVYELDSTTRSLHVVNSGGDTLVLEGSMDGSTWTTDQDVSAAGQFDITTPWQYVRINNTNHVSGTPKATVVGKRVSRFPTSRVLDTSVPVGTPSAPSVGNQGSAGSTAYSYKIVAKNAKGTSAASSAGSTSTGNATLDGTNFNRITWTAVTGATAGYDIYRTAASGTPSSTGKIGSVAAGVLTFDDTGLAGDSATAPTVRTSAGLDIYVGDLDTIKVITQGAQTGNLDVEGSVDGVNYKKIGSSITGAGVFTTASTVTLMRLRVTWSSYTSGTPAAYVVGNLPVEEVPA